MIYFEGPRSQLPLTDIAPGHRCEFQVRAYGVADGFAVEQVMYIDGIRKTVGLQTWTRDEVIDAYEAFHHSIHGKDPRGLDPREGPTRLHPGPAR